MDKRILIFMREDLLEPAGGPAAVCYYYSIEQSKRNENIFDFLECEGNNKALHEKEKWLEKLPGFIKAFYDIVKNIIKTKMLLSGIYPVDKINFGIYDIVHFHDALSLYLYKYQLEGYKGKVILQSHTPQPQRQELIANLPKYVKYFIPNLNKKYEKIDRFAFERADFIVFPCPEAEEPYVNNWPYYKTIQENRKDSYRYVLTGIPTGIPKRNRESVRKELGIIETDFMVSYVGRHNEVKGYNSLKRIGEKILNLYDDLWVVCAGKEEPLTRLEHPRWVEIGWTKDAYSYISAADVFVLSNKETYFDIVMLEILSLSQVVIASRTGGNKYFEKMGCDGVLLYNTEEEAVELLNKVKQMTPEERTALGQKNKAFYEKNHTVSAMYDSYIELLKEISRTF